MIVRSDFHWCRCCVSERIPVSYLEQVREKYLNYDTRAQRKDFLLNCKDPRSRLASCMSACACDWFSNVQNSQSNVHSPFPRSGFSLASGVNSLLGCSTDLLNSCTQGPRAKTPPTTVRHGVPGINTHPTLQVTEAPLLNKGDTVEKYVNNVSCMFFGCC